MARSILAMERSAVFFFSSRRRHTRYIGDWSSDVCSSDLDLPVKLGLPEDSKDFAAEAIGMPRAPIEIGRASCRKECRSRGGRSHGEKKRIKQAITMGLNGRGLDTNRQPLSRRLQQRA